MPLFFGYDTDPDEKYDLTFGCGDDIVLSDDSLVDIVYDSLSSEEDDEEEEEEEEDSENSDEEKAPKKPDSDSSPKEVRNWLEMPPDVMSLIFMKLGPLEILFGAQFVCTAWQKLSKQPHLYRSIDLRKRDDLYDEPKDYNLEKLAICAVHRSAGQLVEFSVEHIGTDPMLMSITYKRSPLKILQLDICQQVTDPQLIAMAKKLPLLEELEMLHCFYTFKGVIRSFGRNCPQLKSFRLTCRGYNGPDRMTSNSEALSIARHMPGLHHLDLFGNSLSDKGLRAILDGCPHLKSLDLRQCFNLKFAGDLKKRCADRNITLKLPNNSTVGYEFDTTCDGTFGPYDRDYEPDNYFWLDGTFGPYDRDYEPDNYFWLDDLA